LRVYTLPPYEDIRYPYLLINAYWRRSLAYVGRDTVSVIVDSGVHSIFERMKLREYPRGWRWWIGRVVAAYAVCRARGAGEVWVVVPDYPADYPGNPIPDNVERTIRNIEYALDEYPSVRWIIPIQGRPNSVSSVARTIEKLEELGLLSRTNYVAVAPTCVTKSVRFLRRLAFTARQLLPRHRIHMFGVTAKAWPEVSRYVDSVDTVNYNWIFKRLGGKLGTRREEKLRAWEEFLRLVEPYLGAGAPCKLIRYHYILMY
jgi:hypothetical protein